MNDKFEPENFGITRSLFLQWRKPSFGEENPTKVESVVWEWLFRSKLSAYLAGEKFNFNSYDSDSPTLCFDRLGQSTTKLPDGRIVSIGGEHEDYYDPDFYIYNDVTVLNPDNTVDFYCYPEGVFAPTDFHTATLVGNQIIIIGCVGYIEQRDKDFTPVYVLDLDTFQIKKINTVGQSCGWIYNHQAEYTPENNAIVISKGNLDLGQDTFGRDNIDDWQLNLNDWSWQKLTDRNWIRWDISRADRQLLHLWDIRQALWYKQIKWEEDYQHQLDLLDEYFNYQPNVEDIKNLYEFSFTHQKAKQDKELHEFWYLEVDGVTVKFKEDWYCLQVTIVGDLPPEIVNTLKTELVDKLSKIQNIKCFVSEY